MPPKIPFLPGNSLLIEPKQEFRKSQTLHYQNGYALKLTSIKIPTEEELTKLMHTNLAKMTFGNKQYHVKPKPMTVVPSFITYDKTTLSFDAYLKEKSVLRKVKIYFYPEDETISVMEPPTANSGLMQGTLIKRHKIPRVPGASEYVHAKDLKVGESIVLYSKEFKIVDCDAFTRTFMKSKFGIEMKDALPMPKDTFLENRAKPSPIKISQEVHQDKLQKFLENDRKVLRFYAVWDDTKNMYGECRDFIVHYYLVDDTVEVREIQKPNSGRDQVSVLLRRQQLPKKYTGLPSLSSSNIYTWKDLRVGKALDILGRAFLLKDCDVFTREFYIQENVCSPEELRPVEYNYHQSWEAARIQLPPYTGYGSIEDSLISCKYLVLKPPRKDFKKIIENENHILRFVARMESKYPEDHERRFVIIFRLADDSVTIYEQKNSGDGLSGKFLERTKALQPGSSLYDPDGPKYLQCSDFVIGKCVEVNRYKFILLEADEFAYKFMEAHPQWFPNSDRSHVINNVAKYLNTDSIQKLALPSSMNRNEFVQNLKQKLVFTDVCDHEWITLARIYETERYIVDCEKFKAEFN